MSATSVTSLGASADLVASSSADLAGAVVPEVTAQPTSSSPSLRLGPLLRLAPVAAGAVAALPLAVVSASTSAWVCLAAWTVALVVRAVTVRPATRLATLLRTDARTAVWIGSAVSLLTVAGAAPVVDARWAVGVVASGAAGTVASRLVLPRRAATRRVVLVGSHEDVTASCSSLDGADAVVAGCYLNDGGPALTVPSGAVVPTTTSLETVSELVSRVGADLVLVLPGQHTTADDVRRLTWALEGNPVNVGLLTPVSAVGRHRLATSDLADRTVLEVAPVGAPALEARLKGAVDRLGAAFLLLALSPLLLALVLGVRLDSKGPGLFVQTRVGRGGKTFRMFKLRSMYVDAEAMKQALIADNDSDGVLFKIRRDPRVTRVGFWLRRSSLDELPQLLNVVRGEMSLIGPRPALPSEVASYDGDALRRLAVKPGITGLWQVSGRSDLLWDESLRLDLYYADNWRLVDDLGIAARTVSAVATGRGAY